MDIFAHGLWTGATYVTVNKKRQKKPLSVGWAVFWGVFPDLFAFTIPSLWILWGLISGNLSASDIPHHGSEPPPVDQSPVFHLAHQLYNFSHSVVVFAIVFALVWAFRKKPSWELGGWLLHIIIDIPTHTYRFFPTPVFWPIVGWKFNGISWGAPWFMVLNYTSLAVVYTFLLLGRSRKGGARY